MSLLKVDNLSKFYGDLKALDGVSLTVNRHEIYGFIGRNGAGKTTTINIILALITKDDGDVYFDGNRIDANDLEYKRRIGFVPDVPSFPRYMTAREFLDFVSTSFALESEHKEERIKQVLDEVGLSDNKQKIHGFSRGMKQRLAIAQALIPEPELLIMDEPTSALDPIGRKEVLDIISKLKQSMTVFYSTHILDDAQKVCDRIGLIDHGKMILEDTVRNILSKHDVIEYYLETVQPVEDLMPLMQQSRYIHSVKPDQLGVLYALNSDVSQMEFMQYLLDHKINISTIQKQAKSLEDVFIEVLHENNY